MVLPPENQFGPGLVHPESHHPGRSHTSRSTTNSRTGRPSRAEIWRRSSKIPLWRHASDARYHHDSHDPSPFATYQHCRAEVVSVAGFSQAAHEPFAPAIPRSDREQILEGRYKRYVRACLGRHGPSSPDAIAASSRSFSAPVASWPVRVVLRLQVRHLQRALPEVLHTARRLFDRLEDAVVLVPHVRRIQPPAARDRLHDPASSSRVAKPVPGVYSSPVEAPQHPARPPSAPPAALRRPRPASRAGVVHPHHDTPGRSQANHHNDVLGGPVPLSESHPCPGMDIRSRIPSSFEVLAVRPAWAPEGRQVASPVLPADLGRDSPCITLLAPGSAADSSACEWISTKPGTTTCPPAFMTREAVASGSGPIGDDLAAPGRQRPPGRRRFRPVDDDGPFADQEVQRGTASTEGWEARQPATKLAPPSQERRGRCAGESGMDLAEPACLPTYEKAPNSQRAAQHVAESPHKEHFPRQNRTPISSGGTRNAARGPPIPYHPGNEPGSFISR